MDKHDVMLKCDAVGMDDLYEWLADEPELTPYLTMRRSAPPPGHMGNAADILIAAVSAGGALTVLAGSLQSWVRRRGISVRVRTRDTDIEITANHADDAVELLQQALDSTTRL